MNGPNPGDMMPNAPGGVFDQLEPEQVDGPLPGVPLIKPKFLPDPPEGPDFDF